MDSTDPVIIDPPMDVVPLETKEVVPYEPKTSGDDLQNDYDLARKTLRQIVTSGMNSVEQLTDLAQRSDHPRVYEALSLLMKTVAESAKDILEVQGKKQELDIDDTPDKTNVNIRQAIFVGTTAELQDQLKKLRNAEPKVINVSPDQTTNGS